MARSGERVPGRRGPGSLERGGVSPEGAFSPRARRTSPEGAVSPRARRIFARGCLGQLFWWAARATGVAIMLCVFWACELVCVCVFYERRWGFPRLFGGPLWPSPTVEVDTCPQKNSQRSNRGGFLKLPLAPINSEVHTVKFFHRFLAFSELLPTSSHKGSSRQRV
jgi:hypothetical protein